MPSGTVNINKAVTLDFGGHTVTNADGANEFNCQTSGIVYQNGTIGSKSQSAIVAGGAYTAYATNLTVKIGTAFYSGSVAKIYYGAGCVFTRPLVSGHNTCNALAYVEDDSVIATGTTLVDNGGTGASRLIVHCGKYAADPSRYVEGARRAAPETTVTAYGTCNYTVRALRDDDPVAAEVQWTGGTNHLASFSDAFGVARSGDTIVFHKDYVVPLTSQGYAGSVTMARSLTIDLNNYAISNTASGNLLNCNADGIVVRNGTVGTGGQSAFVPGTDCTTYVTNCTITAQCACFSANAGSAVVFSGCRIKNNSVTSGYQTCVVRVELYDCDVYSTYWKDSGSGTAVIVAYSGRTIPSTLEAYLGPTTVCLPEQVTTALGTLKYALVPESELPQHDLSNLEARTGRSYYTLFGDAYKAVTNDGTVVICKDITRFTGAVYIQKPMTLDLAGHRFAQTSPGSNFITLQNGAHLTICGGGTIASYGAAHVCLSPETAGCVIDVYDCTFEGVALLWSNTGMVNFLSSGSVANTTSFVSSNGGSTINVSNGIVRCTQIWDYADQAGTQINVAGGKWWFNPLTKVGKRIAVADGLVAAYDADEALYEMAPLSTSLAFDLSSAATPKVYSGTATATACTVDFTCEGAWDGRRKLLADFSGLTGFGELTFTVGDVPEEYRRDFTLRYVNGKLYANLQRGGVLILR